MSIAIEYNSSGDSLHKAEAVELYPSFGRKQETGNGWELVIRGRVVRPRPYNMRRRLLMNVIRRVVKPTQEQLESEIFRERVDGFLKLTRRGRRIRVGMGPKAYILGRRSKRTGHFSDVLELDSGELSHVEMPNKAQTRWVDFHAETNRLAGRRVSGKVLLIAPTGPSVISDIDDTIKISNVANKRALLANTFLEPFQPVDGMAAVFRGWEAAGAAFHYVSSSPWQLFEPLSDFMAEYAYPNGTFHLRKIRLQDASVIQLLLARRRSKIRAIRGILKAFPQRQFVLVGDSTEKDPEIYGSVARRYRSQIARICIRQVPGEEASATRTAKAFRELPRNLWTLFNDASELDSMQPGHSGQWEWHRV